MAPILVLRSDMTDARTHRLSLMLALAGALLMVASLCADRLRHRGEFDLPRFEKSRPLLADWPDHSQRPRA